MDTAHNKMSHKHMTSTPIMAARRNVSVNRFEKSKILIVRLCYSKILFLFSRDL